MSDVVNYSRLRRIMHVAQSSDDGADTPTCICVFIIILVILGLYKRYRDKSNVSGIR